MGASVRRRSTRTAPQGALHAGRSTGEGVADMFYTDVRSILMILLGISHRYELADSVCDCHIENRPDAKECARIQAAFPGLLKSVRDPLLVSRFKMD